MRRAIAFVLVLLIAGACFGAEDEAVLGNLSKMGVTEEQLNADLAEVYFAHSPFTRIKFFDSLNSMLSALGSGRIVAFCIDEYTADYLIARTGQYVKFRPSELPVYNMKYSMLLRDENSELCGRISSAIAEMKADGTLDALKKKYIDDCIAGTDPKAVKPEHFDGAETLRVALTGDRPPMDYFSEAGEPIGFNTALVSEIARRAENERRVYFRRHRCTCGGPAVKSRRSLLL
ncbi:MAG: transporter substrate-binding domain-containing protein [Synergistaceae bacterium]|nr:transporter substrate-binding domain-containing protein [Synergistaceae bacterium]